MESDIPWTVPTDRVVVGMGNCNAVPQAGEPVKRSKAHPTILKNQAEALTGDCLSQNAEKLCTQVLNI